MDKKGMKREKTVWYDHQAKDTWRAEYPEGTMFEFLREAAKKWPSLPAIEFEGRKWSFTQLIGDIQTATVAFKSLGIKEGDIVTLMFPNVPQAIISFYALNSFGAIANFLHPLSSAKEIQDAVKKTGSRFFLSLETFQSKLAQIEWGSERPTFVIAKVSDALPLLKKSIYRLREKKVYLGIDFHRLLKRASRQEPSSRQGSGDQIATIMYSGGTSGDAKGVMLTNLNFNELAIQSYDTMGIVDVSGMKVLNILPIFHGTGLGVCIHSMLCNGICSILIPKFEAKKCFKFIFAKKIEFLFGVPAFFNALVRSPEIEKGNCSFLRVIGSCGDQLPEKTRERMNRYLARDHAPCTITNGYGMTECTAGCCYEPYFGKKPFTSGMMVPDMHAKIVRPGTTQELPIGEIGELCINGPTVMKGYFADPEATSKALRLHEDGKIWLHSGDAFSIDGDGYLTFQQRLDRMFVSSGYNIYPSSIEKTILEIEGVSECSVVGVKDPIVGCRIVAFIKGSDSLEEEIRARCMDQLPAFSVPSRLIFLEDFPRTKMAKVDYRALQSIGEKL